MLTSAMGIMPYSSHNEFTQPQDSIKLQSPLPKETGNAFDDANNSSKGIRLEDSPNSGYQIEYNPETDTREKIEQDIIERDRRDMTRDISPLKKADDATEVDSSYMTIEEVADKIISLYESSKN